MELKDFLDSPHDSEKGSAFPAPGEGSVLILPILDFLVGTEVDDVVLSWIDTVRPSKLRIRKHTDPKGKGLVPWRVTIFLDENNKIGEIVQELICGQRGLVTNAAELEKLTDSKLHSLSILRQLP